MYRENGDLGIIGARLEEMIWTFNGDVNQKVDFWRHDMGLNVIPADTTNKKPLVSWSEWQYNPIPEELHNAWKEQRAFSKGFAIVTGRIWHIERAKGRYFTFAIDKQHPKSKKAKLYFFDSFGDIITTDNDEGGEIFDSTEENSSIVPWSNSYLVERLMQQLAIVREAGTTFDDRKYYNRAYEYLKAGCFNPTSPFVINLIDLTPTLINEIYALDDTDRGFVLELAVGGIIEDINFELYHNSISKILRVELRP
jgi:hypothetical protein